MASEHLKCVMTCGGSSPAHLQHEGDGEGGLVEVPVVAGAGGEDVDGGGSLVLRQRG